MKRAAVIGAGSWGTALATVLAECGLDVSLWCRDPEQAKALAKTHENKRYLPGIALPENITPTDDLAQAAHGAELMLWVVPSTGIASVAEDLAAIDGLPETGTVMLSCTKGLERSTDRRMTEILAAVFPENPVAVLSGPNHAEEVGRKLPTAAVIGCADLAVAKRLQTAFALPWFRTYTSDDVAGIELGGAAKNIYAVCAGSAEGLGLGDNAKAALVTRGLAEMIRLGTALGGRPETFQGLSGVGDLMVTCYSSHSRNHRVGKSLGQGGNIEEITGSMGMVAEGIPNTESFYDAARRAGVETPILDQAYAVVTGQRAAAEALGELLARDPRAEADA